MGTRENPGRVSKRPYHNRVDRSPLFRTSLQLSVSPYRGLFGGGSLGLEELLYMGLSSTLSLNLQGSK